MPGKLIYNREGMGQQSVPLDKDCINIGRSRKSDLLLDFDPLVSGHHARIIKTGKRFFIEDLGSSNKTFLNDKVIRSRCELKHKDRIKIGNVILTYIDMKIRSEDIPVKEAIKRRSKKFSWQRHMIAIIAVLLTGGFCLYYFLSGTFHKSKIEEHIKKGEDYFNDGAYDKAINEYEYVLTLDKDNRKAYGGLGDSRRAMFDYLAAIKEYKKIVKLSPDDTYYFDICNSTGDTWFLYNDYREALRSYKIVEEAHFNNPDDKEILDVYAHTLIGLGKIDFINHKYKEAGDKYKKTLDIDNKNIKALIALGYLYLETGKYEDSMHYFSTVRGAAPKNTEATTGIASIYKKKGDFNRALEVYKDLIKDDASAPEIYTGKADLYRVMKNYGEALSVLKDGEKKDRKNPMIYVIRSKVYFDEKQFHKALTEIERALKIHDNLLEAKNVKAGILQKQNKTDEAIKIYKEVINKDPENFDANKGLGQSYLKIHKYNDSIKYLKKTKDINPLDREIYIVLGDAYYGKKSYDKAIEHYETASGMVQNDLELCCKLGDSYKNLNKKEKAIQWYKIALSKDPEYERAKKGLAGF